MDKCILLERDQPCDEGVLEFGTEGLIKQRLEILTVSSFILGFFTR